MTEQVALVTGQSRGLGAALAVEFKNAGFIVPEGRRSDMDVALPDSIGRYVEDMLTRYGRIDVLVNNAAILGPVGPIEENLREDWRATLAVNLLGPVFLTQAVVPNMKKRGRGKIINIAGGGATGPLPRRSAYAASKAALVRFTESIAEELRGNQIDVNAVLPGPLPTDMFNDILAAGPDKLGVSEYIEHQSLKADPDAIDRAVRLCLYLASPESDGLTGRTISARYDHWPFDRESIADIMSSETYTLKRTADGD